MKKPKSKRGGDNGKPEDSALWDYTASSIEPLKRGKAKGRVLLTSPEAEQRRTDARAFPPAPPQPQPTHHTAHSETSRATKPQSATVAKPATPAAGHSPAPPPMADFDRKSARRIRSGRVSIEARIDLHGMRQHEAHDALKAFIHRCTRRQHRWVLVITGKGKPESRDPDAHFEMTDQQPRGVLRRNVPRWLQEPDLQGLVISYTSAAPHHGGDGALYIHLRKPR